MNSTKSIIALCSILAVVLVLVLIRRTSGYTSDKIIRPQTETSNITPILHPADKVHFSNSDTELYVEIVSTKEAITQGLSGRESLPADQGMLFDLGYDNTYPTFWMVGMNFDLDMLWIKDDTIVDITKNALAPAPGTLESQLPIYRPSVTAGQILEVNAGFVDEHQLKVGDTIEIISKN